MAHPTLATARATTYVCAGCGNAESSATPAAVAAMLPGETRRHTLTASPRALAYSRNAEAARHAAPSATGSGHGRNGSAPRGLVMALTVATMSPTPTRKTQIESAIRIVRAGPPGWLPGSSGAGERACCTSLPLCVPDSVLLLTHPFHKLPAAPGSVKEGGGTWHDRLIPSGGL